MKKWKGKRRYPSSWFAICGFVGLGGFVGLYELFVLDIYNSQWLSYLGFFGAFGFFWLGKYRNTKRDERFILNEKRALSNSACTAAGLTYIAYRFLFSGSSLPSVPIEMKYDLFNIVINLMIALFVILFGVLLHRYETK